MLTIDDLHTGKRSCLVKKAGSRSAAVDQPRSKPLRQCSLGTIKFKKGFLWLDDEQGNLTKLCLPLRALAYIRGDTDPKVLVLIRIMDDRGTLHELQVTKAECRDSLGLIARLLNFGWDYYAPKKTVVQVLDELLTWSSPRKDLLRVEKPGWHDNGESGHKVFIYGDTILAPKGQEPLVHFYGTSPFKKRGTLKEWKTFVAKFFKGNSRQILLLCAAFAGPLLGLLNLPNIGIHFFGASRSGKTVTLKVTCSVLGDEQIMGSWRATGNALLQSAIQRNDIIFPLDELSQAKASDAGEAAYDLMNGYSKSRLNSDSKIQLVHKFRLVVISTGEQSLGAYLAKHGLTASAGQLARMLSIPFSSHGAFENIHGYKNHADFAQAMAINAQKYYGTAGPAFIQYLVDHHGEIEQSAVSRIDEIRDVLMSTSSDLAETGLQLDVARRLATVAYAGELAIEIGVLPFEIGTAIRAACTCFKAWSLQYEAEAADRDPAFSAAKDFIKDHLESFIPFGEYHSAKGEPIGFTHTVNGVTAFLLTQEVFQQQLCLQLGKTAVISTLKVRNLLMLGARGTPTRQITVPSSNNRKQSFYVINSLILTTV